MVHARSALSCGHVRIVSTSSLPIDLAAQLAAVFPDAVVEVPPEGHVPLSAWDLADADALICLLRDTVDEALLERAPKLRVVANCAVGYDNVDLGAAAAAGIAVTNTPDVLTDATAEFAFALALTVARRIPEGERLARSGTWGGWELGQLLGVQLAGKTMGIVGFGRIGQAVAQRALGFGMQVVYADPHDVSAPARRVSVDDLFEIADVVSLHCPLTAQTARIVNAERLARMKATAILVNTARGGCVDEAALVEALRAGRIFGAGLDVYAHEPQIDAPLLTAPRLVLAPHIASATTEARTQMAQLCADAVVAVLSGKRPPNLVVRT